MLDGGKGKIEYIKKQLNSHPAQHVPIIECISFRNSFLLPTLLDFWFISVDKKSLFVGQPLHVSLSSRKRTEKNQFFFNAWHLIRRVPRINRNPFPEATLTIDHCSTIYPVNRRFDVHETKEKYKNSNFSEAHSQQLNNNNKTADAIASAK